MVLSYFGPVVHKGGRRYEATPADVLLAQPGSLDIIPWQSILLTTTVVTDGLQAVIPGSNFTWNAARGAGRKVYLEMLSNNCSANLTLLDGTAIAGVSVVPSLTQTISRSPALDMSVSRGLHPAGAGGGRGHGFYSLG